MTNKNELINSDRLNFGIVDFFMYAISSGLLLYFLNNFNDKYLGGWLFWIYTIIYTLVIPVLTKGQTPAMMLMKIKVINESGDNLNHFQVIKRAIFKFLLIFSLVDAYSLLINKSGKPLYDKILKMKLVKE